MPGAFEFAWLVSVANSSYEYCCSITRYLSGYQISYAGSHNMVSHVLIRKNTRKSYRYDTRYYIPGTRCLVWADTAINSTTVAVFQPLVLFILPVLAALRPSVLQYSQYVLAVRNTLDTGILGT